MERLDHRGYKRISGPAWKPLRPHFDAIHTAITGVAPTVCGTLTTIYIKYVTAENQHPFAVVWVKKSKELVVGLALPTENMPRELSGPPEGCTYAGLTGYFKVTPVDTVPPALNAWARAAYKHLLNQR